MCLCFVESAFLQSIRIRKTRPHFFTDRRERPKRPLNVGNGINNARRYIVKYVEDAFLRCNAAGMVRRLCFSAADRLSWCGPNAVHTTLLPLFFMRGMKSSLNHLFLVVDILIGLSLLILVSNADLGLSRLVVEAGNQWPGRLHEPWKLLYHLAPVPAFVLAGGALVALAGSYFRRRWRRFRRQAIFILLLLALGPGLIVNVILKDHLGRPRPQEIIEFGGQHDFVQFWQPGADAKNSSFPSGHAAIAFFTMAPWFVYRREKPTLARAFLIGGLGFGCLIGLTRILQGAHFISDILWAGGLVYLFGELLSWLLLRPRVPHTPSKN